MRKIEVTVAQNDKKTVVYIGIQAKEIDPDYLKYVFEAKDISPDVEILFIDRAYANLEAFKKGQHLIPIFLTKEQQEILTRMVGKSDEPADVRKQLLLRIAED